MPYKRTGRPPGRPKGYPAGARIAAAREALQKRAEQYVDIHTKAAKVAASKGNATPAQWALEHISEIDAEGKEQRIISSGVDRQSVESGPKGLTVNVGWIARETPALAPIEVKALPGETID
jgi:hypothetical protein